MLNIEQNFTMKVNNMKKKQIIWWIIFILLFLWQLPQNLIALIIMPFIGRLNKIKEEKYTFAFSGEHMNGGISLGNFIFLSGILSTYDTSISHEFGHAVDSKIFGPFYLLIIGIPSLLNATFKFTKCYYNFYTERWANSHANLRVDENCKLCHN